jgi:hypothetical protein
MISKLKYEYLLLLIALVWVPLFSLVIQLVNKNANLLKANNTNRYSNSFSGNSFTHVSEIQNKTAYFSLFHILFIAISSSQSGQFHMVFFPLLLILIVGLYKNRILKTVS